VFVLLAAAAPVVSPRSPASGDLNDRLLPPAWAAGGRPDHLLGTDRLGRDVFDRLVHGARISLGVAAVTVLVAGVIGSTIGLVAGYTGGLVDGLLMRSTDLMLATPLILVALVFAVLFGPGVENVVVVLAGVLWAQYARLARAGTLALRAREFVVAAVSVGAGTGRILRRHVLPNLAYTLLVLATLQVGFVIVLESSLSFLGVGVPPPLPAWGLMVAEGRDFVTSAWWISFFPGTAIALVIVCVNLLGDWLRDRLDPYLRSVF
jgi:peptide/nickel transport system permease protein